MKKLTCEKKIWLKKNLKLFKTFKKCESKFDYTPKDFNNNFNQLYVKNKIKQITENCLKTLKLKKFTENFNNIFSKKKIYDKTSKKTFKSLPKYANSFNYIQTKHSFHMVDPSPWPFVSSLGAFMLTVGGVSYMHKFVGGYDLFLIGVLLTIFVMYTWWRDVIREATFENSHTIRVQKGLRLGMVLFIASEIMFFFSFFWAFFHSSISPVYNIGGVWPPKAITSFSIYTFPLANTFLLITSGVSLTWAHIAVRVRAKKHAIVALFVTLILALIFITLQLIEYKRAPFNISDGIYGSCFYLTTGFHGFHVIIGAVALFVAFNRLSLNHYTNTHHVGLECAIWYWHFVDVVWIFLYATVYWWSNR